MAPSIRTALGLLAIGWLAVATACAGPSGNAGTASSPRQSTPVPKTAVSVWILPPVGLHVHSKPSETSNLATTLARGAEIAVVGQQKLGGSTWLHVHSSNGPVDGWIVDAPQYVIERSMSEHQETSGYSMLYPATWAVQAGNPATFTAPAGDPNGGTLKVQYATDATTLPTLPLGAGTELKTKELSIPVDGVESQVFVYLASSGGTEYFIERKLGTLTYLFDLQQPQSQADTTLFVQLLSSVSAPS